jgi:hypothetical protein
VNANEEAAFRRGFSAGTVGVLLEEEAVENDQTPEGSAETTGSSNASTTLRRRSLRTPSPLLPSALPEPRPRLVIRLTGQRDRSWTRSGPRNASDCVNIASVRAICRRQELDQDLMDIATRSTRQSRSFT